MSRFANPTTVACPKCDSYFYRKVPLSITMHYHIEFSDGGVHSFAKSILPELGRCEACRFIIEDLNALTVIDTNDDEPDEPSSAWQQAKIWLRDLFNIQGYHYVNDFERKYKYLPEPGYEEYAELFINSTNEDEKRMRAAEACREFHQLFCLSLEDQSTIYRSEGYRPQTKEEQAQYEEMCDYLHAHPIMPMLDEYTLLRADLYRLNANFALALEQYALVTETKFNDVVELGKKWCAEQDNFLKILVRRGRH